MRTPTKELHALAAFSDCLRIHLLCIVTLIIQPSMLWMTYPPGLHYSWTVAVISLFLCSQSHR